jgi:8-oxo-dGTP pyrophosphatase MutT (NUDIX family)
MSQDEDHSDVLPRNAGESAEVPALPAATIIVCRDDPFEVLMMRRHEKSSFVPDAWVFPGGALDEGDVKGAKIIAGDADPHLLAMKLCALRELLEEAGLWLGTPIDDSRALRAALRSGSTTMAEQLDAVAPVLDDVVLTSRWITPIGIPKRFDTYFFVAAYDGAEEVSADREEAVEIRWLAPAEALALHRTGEFHMVFPTVRNLEALVPFASSSSLLQARRGAEIRPIQPLLVVDGSRKRIILPEPS